MHSVTISFIDEWFHLPNFQIDVQHFCLQNFIPAPNLLFEVLVVFDHYVLKLLFIAVTFGFKSYTSEKCFNVNFIYDISALPNYFLSDPGLWQC